MAATDIERIKEKIKTLGEKLKEEKKLKEEAEARVKTLTDQVETLLENLRKIRDRVKKRGTNG